MARIRHFMRALSAPPLAYAGERDALVSERQSLMADLETLPPGSRLRPGVEYRLRRVTTRLMQIGAPLAPVPGSTRKDLQ